MDGEWLVGEDGFQYLKIVDTNDMSNICEANRVMRWPSYYCLLPIKNMDGIFYQG